jgi:hypothetical protein
MQQINVTRNSGTAVSLHARAGRPTVPLQGRQPIVERKISDPSSASPKGERYPIPSFFEYRIRPKEFDPL